MRIKKHDDGKAVKSLQRQLCRPHLYRSKKVDWLEISRHKIDGKALKRRRKFVHAQCCYYMRENLKAKFGREKAGVKEWGWGKTLF